MTAEFASGRNIEHASQHTRTRTSRAFTILYLPLQDGRSSLGKLPENLRRRSFQVAVELNGLLQFIFRAGNFFFS